MVRMSPGAQAGPRNTGRSLACSRRAARSCLRDRRRGYITAVRCEALASVADWLDNGNNKKALQEAEKVLKKHPSNQCARVLKGLALLRLGKETECLTIIDKVRSEVPRDDSTLQAMTICYREIQQRKFMFCHASLRGITFE